MSIRQITAVVKNGNNYVVRYDVEKGLLYQQNRSKDVEMSLDCFLDMLKSTRKRAGELGHNLIEERVEVNSLWK